MLSVDLPVIYQIVLHVQDVQYCFACTSLDIELSSTIMKIAMQRASCLVWPGKSALAAAARTEAKLCRMSSADDSGESAGAP
jgi:hypothetical protein